MNSIVGLALSIVAGLSTVVGALLIILMKNKGDKKIVSILGFSTGIMIVVALFDLLPETCDLLFNSMSKPLSIIVILISIIIGIIITLVIDKFLHHDEKKKNLSHVGLITAIAFSLHKFPEGIAIFIASYANISLGIAMALVIGIHHIPEGMAIAAPVYYATGNKIKTMKYAFYSGLAEPLGAITAFLFLKPIINDLMLGILFSIAIGIFLFIIVEELIPTLKKYNYHKLSIFSIGIGIIFMSICLILF